MSDEQLLRRRREIVKPIMRSFLWQGRVLHICIGCDNRNYRRYGDLLYLDDEEAGATQ